MAELRGTGTSIAARLGPAGVAVTVGGFAVNALGYAVPLIGSRQLTPADFGALATVLGLGAIATVPALGLQAALAVRWARDGAVSNAGRVTAATAAISTAALAVASPLISVALHLSLALPLLLAVTTAAVVTGSRWLGELQGGQRFIGLAAGMVLMAVARFGGVIAGLRVGWGVTASVALGAAVAWLAVPVLAGLTRMGQTRAGLTRTEPTRVGVPAAAGPSGPVDRLRARDVTSASGATLAMLAVSYADLLIARHLLPAADSGAYGVGAVLTKGALWAPQVVTVLALPLLARGSRRALVAALAVVGTSGAVLVSASAVAGDLAMRLAGGAAYAGLAPYAAGFAAVGALYAVVFVLVNAEIAAGVRWPAAPLPIALVGLAVAASWLDPPTLGGILAVSACTAAVTGVAMGVAAVRRHRGAGTPTRVEPYPARS